MTRFCGVPSGEPRVSILFTVVLLALPLTLPKTTCTPSNLKYTWKNPKVKSFHECTIISLSKQESNFHIKLSPLGMNIWSIQCIPALNSPWCFDGGDEKLGPIGVFATICHGNDKFLMLQLKIFICKFCSINAAKSKENTNHNLKLNLVF